MATTGEIRTDVLIFGGGVAGLWLLDRLRRGGRRGLLLESAALGSGQTVASQGIIHGGLKYTLDGLLNPSAAAIRDMPGLWGACLRGEAAGEPDLRRTPVRSPHCHLWRTDDLLSRMAMVGARAGLAVTPRKLARDERPDVLARCPEVFLLEEPVIAPAGLIADLAAQHAQRCLRYDAERTSFERESDGVRLAMVARGAPQPIAVRSATVVLTAGAGNAALAERLGGRPGGMQRRPLHMPMLRGDLPDLYGHCVDRAHTRVTITTARDAAGRTVWQVGGQIAEDGVGMSAAELIDRARRELYDCIPGLRLDAAEWSSYRVDRAEPASGGRRPSSAHAERDGPVIVAWPTKLALAPRLADAVEALLPPPTTGSAADAAPADEAAILAAWPRPPVARPPWDEERTWIPAR